MPKVKQEHLDARRQQIIDAARDRFAAHGFAHTSMADIVAASGMSTGAIYRYFASKDEIIMVVCDQASDALPDELTAESITRFLEHVRALALDKGHARLIAQVYAEAAVSPALATLVEQQLTKMRAEIAGRVPAALQEHADSIAEAFVGLSAAYNQQLAVRGDVDPTPFGDALISILTGYAPIAARTLRQNPATHA